MMFPLTSVTAKFPSVMVRSASSRWLEQKALAGHKDEAFFSENAAAQASRKSSPRVTNEAVQKAAAAAKSGKSSAMSAAAAASALAGEGTAHMPRLFSFLSADNQGMEAYFHAQFLVVEVGSGRGKKASLHSTHAFKPQCWYFVGLEHTCKQGLIGKAESELKLYIDGSLYESRPFDFPRISKPLAFCCIGTNPPPTIAGLQRRRRQCPLFAEMGPIYIFKEPIGPERMSSLASRGGDVLPSFGYGAGLPWLATNERVQSMAEESALLDAEIGGCIHLLYHPNLLSGRFCPDASPSGAAGMLRRPAEVLGQVHVATRMRPVEALWALAYGGPMSLLPLTVSNVHENSLEPQQGNLSLSLATTTLAAPIFRIIAMAIQHPRNNEELCHTRGPEVLINPVFRAVEASPNYYQEAPSPLQQSTPGIPYGENYQQSFDSSYGRGGYGAPASI